MNRPRITCSFPWLSNSPAKQPISTKYPQGHPGCASASSSWACVQTLQHHSMASQTSPVLQPLPLTSIPRGQKPRSRVQWRLGKPKSKPSVPSGALMCPGLCYRRGISIPCWTSITSAAVPCNENIFIVTETQHEVARKTEILLFWSSAHCSSN